jgi:WD40 repeat protein
MWSGWDGGAVLDTGTGKQVERIYGDGDDRIRNISFGSSGRLAIARNNGRGELRTLIDSAVIGEAKRGCRAAFEAPGDAIACIGSDTQLWRDGKRVGRELKYAFPDVAVMTPDGKLIAYDSYGDIRLVTVGRAGLVEAGQISDHLDSVDGLALSGDGKLLVSVGSNVALVHELTVGTGGRGASPARLRHILEGHDRVNAVAISADGRRVATAAGREAWIWDLKTGRVVARIEASVGIAEALAFAPDGSLIAAGGRGSLTWWQLP